jgi:hypothetical protein
MGADGVDGAILPHQEDFLVTGHASEHLAFGEFTRRDPFGQVRSGGFLVVVRHLGAPWAWKDIY